MERDKRLGRDTDKGREYPIVTITGGVLPPKPYTTIGLEDGYFVVLDSFLSNEKRDTALLELRGIVQGYRKKSNKETQE